MPSTAVPPEVWSRIFHFVAPPLPFVGMEHESFVEDAKERRGAAEVKKRWTGIDSLMLVSKRVNELVAPIFWSHLVLASAKRAMDLCWRLETRPEAEKDYIHSLVKVLSLPNANDQEVLDPAPSHEENPALFLSRLLANVVHIHIISPTSHVPTLISNLVSLAARTAPLKRLEGLSGLVLGEANWEAAMVALRHLAPSLHRLAIQTSEPDFPGTTLYSFDQNLIDLPRLEALEVRSSYPAGAEPWLEMAIFGLWCLPKLRKAGSTSVFATRRSGNKDLQTTLDSAYLADLGLVSGSFRTMGELNLVELAFELGPSENEAYLAPAAFRERLDWAEGGQVSTIKVVVLVETVERPISKIDRCLVELVNRRRLPSLEKVVWVLAQPGNDASVWSQLLVKWSHDLIQAGVRFEIQ